MGNLVKFGCPSCTSPHLRERNGKLHCIACDTWFEKDVETNEERDARIKYITRLDRAEELLSMSPPHFDDAEDHFRKFIKDYPDHSDGYWGLVRARYGIKYEDDVTGKIPSCYKSSYEDFRKDSDFMKALSLAENDYIRNYIQEQAELIADICKEWREETKKHKYDIFISFKDKDEKLGISDADRKEMSELYIHLLEKGYKVFFSPYSMKNHTGKYCDPYIFSALQSAKVLIVYGSKPEYFTTIWVQNEWTRFIRMIAKKEKKAGSCIVVYNGFSPYELPPDLRKIQAIDASQQKRFYGEVLNSIHGILAEEKKPDENEELIKKVEALMRKQEELARQNEESQKRQEELQKSLEEEKKKNNVKQVEQKPTAPSPGEKNATKAPSKVTPKEEPKKPEIDPDFEIVDGCLKKYKGNKQNIVIPDGVTAIDDYIFYNSDSIVSVTIPQSITSIGYCAFGSCGKLTGILVDENNRHYKSIDGNLYSKDGTKLLQYASGKKNASFEILENVSKIEETAFYGCETLSSITVDKKNKYYMSVDGNLYSKDGKVLVQYAIGKKDKSYKIIDGVESIRSWAFTDCYHLSSVHIPNTVTYIGQFAFRGCSNLVDIVIPNSVEKIDSFAFALCEEMNSIVISDSVASVGTNAFSECENLTIWVHSLEQVKKWDAEWNSDNRPVQVIEQVKKPEIDPDFEIVDGCLKKYHGNKEEVVIPNGVTSIGDRAFYICFELISITIPDSVTSIGNGAFSNCSSLTSVTIPKSVTHIGGGAFSYCNLDTIVCHSPNYQVKGGCLIEDGTKVIIGTNNSVVPYGVTTIAESAFAGRKGLTHINIPDSVTFIGSHSFSGCESLAYITIPDNVTSIESMTFASCENLSSIVIGRNVTHIDYNAFSDCNIDTIACHSPKYRVESGCLIEDGTKVIIGTNNSVIPYGITTIGDCAFSGRKKLTVIDIPDSVTSINGLAFSNCENLTNITIPNGVTNIDSFVFDRCFNLVNIVIPDSVTNIGNYAFSGCMTLNNIVIPNSVASVGTNAFFCCENLTIFVHSLDQVKKWGDGWNPNNCPVKVIGNKVTTKSTQKTEAKKAESKSAPKVKSSTASSPYLDFEIKDSCLEKYRGNEENVVIPNGVVYIGWGAFHNCKNLKSVTIPYSVTSIGNSAFSGCTNLTSITIPDSVTGIDWNAFEGCESLTSITIGNSVTTIGEFAFSGCFNLRSVNIPHSVTSIGGSAFTGCISLKSVSFSDAKNWYAGYNSKISIPFLGNSSIAAKCLTSTLCKNTWYKKK